MCGWAAHAGEESTKATLRIPGSTITPTTMRITFSAPFLTRFAGGTEVAGTLLGVAGVEKFDAGEEAAPRTHLLQNRIPGVRTRATRIAEAIDTYAAVKKTVARVYRRLKRNRAY